MDLAHDQAAEISRYDLDEVQECDAFVVDLEDRREDLTVQVRMTLGGEWHRKAVGGMHTACGQVLNGYATRFETYGHSLAELCKDGCFTKFELTLVTPEQVIPDFPFSIVRKRR